MKEGRSLLGKPIAVSPKLKINEQVYDILYEEIQSGRWKIGERLPSITSLAEESGLSSTPIHRAFELLQKEGYLIQKGRKGTFLASITSTVSDHIGTIGVAMSLSQMKIKPHYQVDLHFIIKTAEKHNYLTEFVYLTDDQNMTDIDTVHKYFSKNVKGVICFHPFSRPYFYEIPPDKLPLVFLSEYNGKSVPCVHGDVFLGFYYLTKYVIDKGHRNIVLYCQSMLGKKQIDDAKAGHEQAMQEPRLKVNLEAIEYSYSKSDEDLSALSEFLETFNDATAIITTSGTVARNLVAMADIKGIVVPEDLSIVSQGGGPIRINISNKKLTHIRYDSERMIELAFDILLEQIKTRKIVFSHAKMHPTIEEGHSLVQPGSTKEVDKSTSDNEEFQINKLK